MFTGFPLDNNELVSQVGSRSWWVTPLSPLWFQYLRTDADKPHTVAAILLGEIINRTVHCFWVMATERTADGYVLWLAIYVRRLNWFTPVYMALITPVLKWVIYPAMMKGVRQRWAQAFPPQTETPNRPLRGVEFSGIGRGRIGHRQGAGGRRVALP